MEKTTYYITNGLLTDLFSYCYYQRPGNICLIIPGFIVALLTFPGIMLHEWAHKLFCDRTRTQVFEVEYFRFGNPAGYVIHEMPRTFKASFLIVVGPFIINSIFAIFLLMFVVMLEYSNYMSVGYIGLVYALFAWLGISIAMHAFPSTGDAKILWNATARHSKNKPILLIFFLIAGFLYVGALLSILWLDVLYGFGIYYALKIILVGTIV